MWGLRRLPEGADVPQGLGEIAQDTWWKLPEEAQIEGWIVAPREGYSLGWGNTVAGIPEACLTPCSIASPFLSSHLPLGSTHGKRTSMCPNPVVLCSTELSKLLTGCQHTMPAGEDVCLRVAALCHGRSRCSLWQCPRQRSHAATPAQLVSSSPHPRPQGLGHPAAAGPAARPGRCSCPTHKAWVGWPGQPHRLRPAAPAWLAPAATPTAA